MLQGGRLPKEPWENRVSEYEKVRGERITQGKFGDVYRMKHIDPDSAAQTLVVIKEVRHKAGNTRQEEHELECLRRLNDHRFRGHVIKLLNVSTRWTY